jgi:hypothetical protein
MNRILTIIVLLTLVTGCSKKEPVTLIFTGDVEGRLVPAG